MIVRTRFEVQLEKVEQIRVGYPEQQSGPQQYSTLFKLASTYINSPCETWKFLRRHYSYVHVVTGNPIFSHYISHCKYCTLVYTVQYLNQFLPIHH